MKQDIGDITLKVCETFTSIQGEGRDIGFPFFFIRLSGCNLRCSYCDTKYAYNNFKELSLKELLSLWKQSGIKRCLITGGEPLLQKNSIELMKLLISNGASVYLETNGSIDTSIVPFDVTKIVDWKTPGSKMENSFLISNLDTLTSKDQIKFVITDEKDYIFSKERVKKYDLLSFTHVIFSVAMPHLKPIELAQWILRDKLEVRFQIQLHKIIWGDKKGV